MATTTAPPSTETPGTGYLGSAAPKSDDKPQGSPTPPPARDAAEVSLVEQLEREYQADLERLGMAQEPAAREDDPTDSTEEPADSTEPTPPTKTPKRRAASPAEGDARAASAAADPADPASEESPDSDARARPARKAKPADDEAPRDTTPDVADDEAVLLERVKGLDADRLLKEHPRLAHRLGALADKLAKDKAKEELDKRQREIEARNQEIDGLRSQIAKARDNPLDFADEFARQGEEQLTAQERAEQEQRSRAERETIAQAERQRVFDELSSQAGTVLAAFQQQLPEAIQQKLGNKRYDGYWHEGFAGYLRDVVEEMAAAKAGTPDAATVEQEIEKRVKVRVAAERRKWEQDQEPDDRAAALAEEPSPDTGGGTAVAGRKRFTAADIDKMSPAEYEANKQDIFAAIGW